jgi:hypothetical protein
VTSVATKLESSQPQTETAVDLFDNWIDPIETEIRGFIEELIRTELEASLARPRSRQRASRTRMMPRPLSVTGLSDGRGR